MSHFWDSRPKCGIFNLNTLTSGFLPKMRYFQTKHTVFGISNVVSGTGEFLPLELPVLVTGDGKLNLERNHAKEIRLQIFEARDLGDSLNDRVIRLRKKFTNDVFLTSARKNSKTVINVIFSGQMVIKGKVKNFWSNFFCLNRFRMFQNVFKRNIKIRHLSRIKFLSWDNVTFWP